MDLQIVLMDVLHMWSNQSLASFPSACPI